MGDLIKKQKDQIKILLAERFKLRQDVESMKKKANTYDDMVHEYQRMKGAYDLMEGKIRQVMEDISQKVAETSLARSELANTKRDLEAAYRDITGFQENETRYIKTLAKAETELTSLKLKFQEDGIGKVRERLRKRNQELDEYVKQNRELITKLAEADRKITYLESNAKLSDQKAV